MSRDGVEIREKSIRLFFVWPKGTPSNPKGTENKETLRVNGVPLRPTVPNIAFARREKAKIDRAIELGTFVRGNFFPDSPKADAAGATATFSHFVALWLQTKGRLAGKTRDQYRNACAFWERLLDGERPISGMSHGYVAAKVGGHPWPSNKLMNNYLICLRGVFKLAGRELKLDDNATEGIVNLKHQAPAPDPLSGDEAAKIIADLKKHYAAPVWAYFVFAFATGMRPEEMIALRWADVDWNEKTIRVERAKTGGKIGPLKTYMQRDVDLTEQSLGALKAMKALTYMKDAEIFENPVTRKPWHDERSQRDHYWKPSLRRCGIRDRRAYQTRHTYGAESLLAGCNPTWVARQMGHKNAKMLFEVYAKWIDKADRGRERDKLEAAHRLRRAS